MIIKKVHVDDVDGEITLQVVCPECQRHIKISEEDAFCPLCFREIEQLNISAWTEYGESKGEGG